MIVFFYSLSLGGQKQPPILVARFVIILGAIHEYSEIVTHNYALEIPDVLVNFIGVAICTTLEQALLGRDSDIVG